MTKKKIVRLTENDIRNMVKKSVRRAVNEAANGSACDDLEQVREILDGLMNSGFIPFSSPSPSSTEEELKNTIIEAARLVDKAMHLCGKLGYNGPVANVV